MPKEPGFQINQNNLGFFEFFEEAGSDVIVGNARNLAVLNRVIEWMAHCSTNAIERFPKVTTLESYLSEQHYLLSLRGSHLDGDRFVLTPMQEQAIWQTIVKENLSLDWPSSIQVARELRAAWKAQSYWELNSRKLEENVSSSPQPFLKLSKIYRSKLEQLAALDQVMLMESSLSREAAKKVITHGLFSAAPKIQSWLRKNSRYFSTSREKSRVRCHHRYSTKTEELESALSWASEISIAETTAKVAVVVDSDPSEAIAIRSLCEDIFGYNFHYSQHSSLDEKPFVKLAILILELKNIPRWDVLSHLINHPLLYGADVEGSERALLDLELRSAGRYEWPLKWVIGVLESSAKCPLLKTILVEISSNNETINRKDSIEGWISFFRKRWKISRWMDEESKSLIDPELQDDFASVSDQVSELNMVLGRVGYSEAIWYFKNALNAKKIRNHRNPTNVFIVSAEEAVIIDPTHLWVTECTAEKPSVSAETVSLLPFSEQRIAGIPGSNPSIDFIGRQILFDSLNLNREEINLSFSETHKDVDVIPSPFAPELLQVSSGGKDSYHFYRAPEKIEVSASRDDFGPIIEDKIVSKGGVSVLEAQAACPFKAFAKYRLDSVSPEEVTPGVSRKTRGIVTHKALATIWNELKNHSNLVEKKENDLSLLVRMAVEANKEDFTNPTDIETACVEVEKNLLNSLILKWIEFEKTAPPFIASMLEEEIKVVIDDLKLTCRVDRVDILDNGTKRIVDYKTGECSLSTLNPPRTDSPQLLLYAVYSSVEKVSSVAFAKVNSFDSRFLARDISDLAEKHPSWQADLEGIADELQRGFASVMPKRGLVTCASCDQQLFCRIKTKDMNADDVD